MFAVNIAIHQFACNLQLFLVALLSTPVIAILSIIGIIYREYRDNVFLVIAQA